MGCSCEGEKCEIREAWTRPINTIELAEGDALTHDGQETCNLLAGRGIDNVILCGVHLNMCVLGRPFAICQMVKLGKNVALMRDMTDTMYTPGVRPASIISPAPIWSSGMWKNTGALPSSALISQEERRFGSKRMSGKYRSRS